MHYAGEKSMFEGTFDAVPPGKWKLQVIGMDPKNANFGMDAMTVIVK